MKLKTYFCHLEYLATGEGLTIAIGFVIANNKKEAQKEFCKQHMCRLTYDETETIEYFSPGVYVFDMKDKKNHPKVEQVMKTFLSENAVKSIFAAYTHGALMECYFKHYANYS
jgi:hypothetical protein